MKFYVIAVFALIVGLASAAHIHDDGQPGCKEAAELEIVNFRNTWDPTKYWVCQQLRQPGVPAKCLDGHAWLDSQKKCVEWHEWEWEEPTHPLSKP